MPTTGKSLLTWAAVLGWIRRSTTGKVLAVLVLFFTGACLARLVLGPVEEEPAAHAPAPPAEQPVSGTATGSAAPLDVADAFAHGWAAGGPTEQWHARLLANATPALAAELARDAQATRPSWHITGPAQVTSDTGSTMDVAYSVDGGVLELALVHLEGRWLVDDVRLIGG